MKKISKLLICFMILFAGKSFGQLSIKNSTGKKIHVSISYFEKGMWFTEGWWTVDNGATSVVYSNELTKPYMYYYAVSDEGVQWGGSFGFTVKKEVKDVPSYKEKLKADPTSCGFGIIDLYGPGKIVKSSYIQEIK